MRSFVIMKISILTLFPEMFKSPFAYSIIKRAQERSLINLEYINLRDFGISKHRLVDDSPYGGGIGMVMRVDVLHKAISNVKCQISNIQCNEKVVLLTASGNPFQQQRAQQYARLDHLILICGHYEGIDDRLRHFIDEELSIGDFVVT